MDSVEEKKRKLQQELECSGVECVQLVRVAADLSLSRSGIWYVCALDRDGHHLFEAKAESPDGAMDFLTSQITAL